jgi:hypothetical protein
MEGGMRMRLLAGGVVLTIAVALVWALLRDEWGASRQALSSADRLLAKEAGDVAPALERETLPEERAGTTAEPAHIADAATPLTITVAARASRRPIAEAEVLLRRAQGDELARGRTDADGHLVVSVPRPDAYLRVRVLADRFAAFETNIARDRDAIELLLEEGASVHGRVWLRDTNQPGAGAEIELFQDGLPERPIVADAEGRFGVCWVQPHESLTIRTTLAGYVSKDLDIKQPEGDREVEIVLGEGGVIDGEVRDTQGRPCEEISVDVYRIESGRRRWELEVDSAANGSFRAAGLELPAFYQLRAWAHGSWFRSEPIELTPDRTSASTIIVLAPPRTGVALRIVNGAGEPQEVSGSVAVLIDGVTISNVFFDTSPSEERRSVLPMDAGKYDLAISSKGWPEMTRSVQVREREIVPLDVVLPVGAGISGVVVDREDHGLEHIPVSFVPTPPAADQVSEPIETSSDAKGHFRLRGLPRVEGRLRIGDWIGNDSTSELANRFGWLMMTLTPADQELRLVLPDSTLIKGRVVPAPESGRIKAGVFCLNTGDTASSLGGVDQPLFLEPDGSFSFWIGAGGVPVDLLLEVDPHAPILLQNRTFVAGSINDLGDLRFGAGRTVTGSVSDRSGTPIEGASLGLSLSIVPWDRSTTSDAHGSWKIEGLPEANPLVAALVIRAEGFMPVYEDVDLASIPEIRRALYHASRITLHVTPPEAGVGGRVPLADVKDDLGDWFETDAEGIAIVTLAPGRYRIALDADPARDAGTFEVREGIAQDIVVKR